MKDRIIRLIQLLKTLPPKKLLMIAGLLVIAAAIPFTVAVQQLQQNLQQEAAQVACTAGQKACGNQNVSPNGQYPYYTNYATTQSCKSGFFAGDVPSCPTGQTCTLTAPNTATCQIKPQADPNQPVEGQRRCNTADACKYEVFSGGSWGTTQSCSPDSECLAVGGTTGASCRAKPGACGGTAAECTDGQRRCGTDKCTYQVCTGGVWQPSQTCIPDSECLALTTSPGASCRTKAGACGGGQGAGAETCLATPGQTCETGTNSVCPAGKMNLGASGTCSAGKVCCRPVSNAPDLSSLPNVCQKPPHPYWSCPTTSAKDIERFWSKYADVLIPGTCRPDKFGQDGCQSASPESALPPNVYAGTVIAGALTKTQVASLKYSNSTTSTFTKALPTCKISSTLSNMWNHCQSGAYAGSKADFEAAMKTVEDIYVARMIIDSNNNLTRDQIIKSMSWYTGPTGCKASINPTGIEPLGDYDTKCALVPDGAPEPTDHLCKQDSQCPTGMKCTVATGQCSYLGGSNPPPPTGGNPPPPTDGTCTSCIFGRCVAPISLLGQSCGTSNPSPSPSPTGTGGTVLNFNLGLDGVGSTGDHRNPNAPVNQNPKTRTNPPFTVEVLGAGNSVVAIATENFRLTNGRYVGSVRITSELTTGSHRVLVKSPLYLKKDIGGLITITAGRANNIPQANLTSGDIIDDNVINIQDYNVLISCSVFGTDNKGACGGRNADLTDDGLVDQDDYNLLLREWSVQHGDSAHAGIENTSLASLLDSDTTNDNTGDILAAISRRDVNDNGTVDQDDFILRQFALDAANLPGSSRTGSSILGLFKSGGGSTQPNQSPSSQECQARIDQAEQGARGIVPTSAPSNTNRSGGILSTILNLFTGNRGGGTSTTTRTLTNYDIWGACVTGAATGNVGAVATTIANGCPVTTEYSQSAQNCTQCPPGPFATCQMNKEAARNSATGGVYAPSGAQNIPIPTSTGTNLANSQATEGYYTTLAKEGYMSAVNTAGYAGLKSADGGGSTYFPCLSRDNGGLGLTSAQVNSQMSSRGFSQAAIANVVNANNCN